MRKFLYTSPLLSLAFVILASLHSFAQTDTGYYFFEEDFTLSADTGAVNAGITIKLDSVWRLTVTNKISKKIVMKGSFLGKHLEREHGLFEYFFQNGQPKKRGVYRDGIEQGLWERWTLSGKLIDSTVYNNGDPILGKGYYYDEEELVKGYFFNNNETQEKIVRNFYGDGTVKDEAVFMGKAGYIKRYYPGGGLTEQIIFDKKGKRTSVKHFDQDGKEISEKAFARSQEKQLKSLIENFDAALPAFKGGKAAFERFLLKNLKLPDFYRQNQGFQRIQFSFRLNEKGEAKDIKMINPTDAELEKAIIELLRVMPPWDMKGYKSWGPLTHIINIT